MATFIHRFYSLKILFSLTEKLIQVELYI